MPQWYKGELSQTKIQKTLHTHKQTSKKKLSKHTNKLLKKTLSFLIIINKQTKIKQKKHYTIFTKTNKNQTKQLFFSFLLLFPQRYIIFLFFSFFFFFFFSLLSLSLSLSLSFFLHLFYAKYTQINPECSGPKINFLYYIFVYFIFLQNNLVLVN